MQQCFCHLAAQAFLLWQMVRSAWKQWWRTQHQDVMAHPCLHLYWLSVSASETTSHRACLITHYINFIQFVSPFPRLNPAQHPLIKQVQGSNGCAVRLLLDLQHTRGLETHSYVFSTQYLTWVRPLLGDAISTIPTGLEDAPCVTVSIELSKNYVDLKLCTTHPTAVTVTVQANLQCSIFLNAPPL